MFLLQKVTNTIKDYLVFDQEFRILLSVSVLTNLSGTLWSPLLGLYFTNNLGVSIIMLGLITTVQQLVLSLVVVPSGLFSDSYGRKRMMILSMLFSVLALVTLFLVKDIPWLFLISIFQGLSGAFMEPSRSAYVIDVIPHERRGMAYATLSFLQSLSAIITSFAAGLIIEFLSFHWLFGIALILELVSLIETAFFLKESLNREAQKTQNRQGFNLQQIRDGLSMFKYPPLLAVLFSVIFHSLGLGIQNTYLPVYANKVLLISLSSVSVMLGLERLGILIGHFPSGRIVDKYGEEISFSFHIFFTSPMMILYIFSGDLFSAGFILFIWGLTFGLDSVSRNKLIAKYRLKSGAATAFGMISLVSGMVSLVSPTIGGWIWTNSSPQTVFYTSAAVNVLGSIPLFILWLHNRNSR